MHYSDHSSHKRRYRVIDVDNIIPEEDDYTDLHEVIQCRAHDRTTDRQVYYIQEGKIKLVITDEGVLLYTMRDHKYIPLKTEIDEHGYVVYYSYDKTYLNRRYLHALVAKTVHGPKPEGYSYHFIDGVKTNCHPSNIEYIPNDNA